MYLRSRGLGKPQLIAETAGEGELGEGPLTGAAGPSNLRDKGDVGIFMEETDCLLKCQVSGVSFFPESSGAAGL